MTKKVKHPVFWTVFFSLVSLAYIFPILLVYSVMVTAAMGFLASLRFETMEQFV